MRSGNCPWTNNPTIVAWASLPRTFGRVAGPIPRSPNVQCEMSNVKCEIRDPLLWSRSSHTEAAEVTEVRWSEWASGIAHCELFICSFAIEERGNSSLVTRHMSLLPRMSVARNRAGVPRD